MRQYAKREQEPEAVCTAWCQVCAAWCQEAVCTVCAKERYYTVEIEILQERGRASVVPRDSKWQCGGMEERCKRGPEQAEIERRQTLA